MKKEKSKANLGDIIRSEKFAFGYYDRQEDKRGYLVPALDKITVDGKTKEYNVEFRKPGTPWDKPSEYETVNLGAYDKSRGESLFVVEKAQMQGGGTGHGPHDIYPDGWYVEARRLNEDNSYNPDGELIKFYQSGCFNCLIPEVEVEIVGKMKQIFIKEEEGTI